MLRCFILISLVLTLMACNDEMANQMKVKPTALGRLNEIEVIADGEMWDGPVGDTINHYFGSAYPIMPTPEPIFDIRHFTPNDLISEPLRKELRTYLIVADLQDEDSPTTKMVRKDLGEERYLKLKSGKPYSSTVGHDKWARNQMLIYILGNGKDNLYKGIKDNFPAIAKKINQHDEDQLMSSIYTVKRTNIGLSAKVKELYGIDMNVPGDFKLAVENKPERILWIRRDDKGGAILNMMMESEAYEGPKQFETEALIAQLNALSKDYVTTNTAGSHMQINTDDLPVYDYTYSIDGQYTKELRGVWEMTEDFMAGPFVGYAIHHEESNSIIYIYAFIYGPGEAKRNLMQQMDYIVKNVSINGSKKASITADSLK